MESLIGFTLGIIGSLLAAEVYSWAPSHAKTLIEKAIDKLPDTERDRYREEWIAHLEECPGSLAKLAHAAGCFTAARRMALPLPQAVVARANHRKAAAESLWSTFAQSRRVFVSAIGFAKTLGSGVRVNEFLEKYLDALESVLKNISKWTGVALMVTAGAMLVDTLVKAESIKTLVIYFFRLH